MRAIPLLAALLSLPAAAAGAQTTRVAVFRAEGFPTVDAPAIPAPVLEEALRGLAIDTLRTATEIGDRLRRRDHDVLVLPYGSAFPEPAWPAIRAFVEHGGSLVVLGGAPLHQPVRPSGDAGAWVLGPRHPTYARALLIGAPATRS